MVALMMGSLYQAADYEKQLPDIRTDLALVKALLGIAVSCIVALVIKTFFI